MKKYFEKLKEKQQVGISVNATGKRIKQIMDMNGFNISDISELMNISYQAVRKWIKGETLPEISNFYILSQYLGVTINDLIVPMNRKDFDLYTSVNACGLMSYYFCINRMVDCK